MYPDDAELLFVESTLAKEAEDARAAEELLLKLIRGREGDHLGAFTAAQPVERRNCHTPTVKALFHSER